MEKDIQVGRFKMTKKQAKNPADWFLLQTVSKFWDEQFFHHYDTYLMLTELIANFEGSEEELNKLGEEAKWEKAMSFLYWNENVRYKETIDKEEYLAWAKDLYENHLPTQLKNLRKKEYENIVAYVQKWYGPQFIWEKRDKKVLTKEINGQGFAEEVQGGANPS